ncbi:hypothetical protein DSO57_1027047 [Entomophthora muscae]|uniref:Uncharacterized protein n=1 Tax=Entomophthora muscae TaxID=34485 RepID=A0ACC2UMI4_9FUNG|nr:hypothetical protein DSO57_1027047 [Entomophthora muscae]
MSIFTSIWLSSPSQLLLGGGRAAFGNTNAHQDLPSGLAQLQQLMNDVPQLLPLGIQSPLILTAPTPMKVDANASPS